MRQTHGLSQPEAGAKSLPLESVVQAPLPVALPVINGQKQIVPIAPNTAVGGNGDNASEDEEAWENLDQLVDDFDALEL